MKTMTCKQLGGACDEQFHAATFEELADLSRTHALMKARDGDQGHIDAMNEMGEKMTDPQALNEWIEKRRQEFGALPDDE